MKQRFGWVLGISVAALLLASSTTDARAEVVQLLDNTQVNCKILHYYDGVFHVETSSGDKLELPISKIKNITFKLPPPRPEFSTAEKTFARYREALTKGDLARVIDCYALMFQGVVAAQIGSAPEDLRKMQKEMEATKFDVKSSKVTGQTAMLKVTRSRGDDVDTAELKFVLENGEWKMTP